MKSVNSQYLAGLSLPWSHESLLAVEVLAESAMIHFRQNNVDLAAVLRTGVVELTRFALAFKDTPSQPSIATLTIFSSTGDTMVPSIELRAPGPSIAMDGTFPPYDNQLIGFQQYLGTYFGAEVVATVSASNRILFECKKGSDLLTGPRLFDEDAPHQENSALAAAFVALHYWGTLELEWSPSEDTVYRLKDPILSPFNNLTTGLASAPSRRLQSSAS